MAHFLEEIVEAVISGNAYKVKEGVQRALKGSIEPVRIITEGFVKAMDIVSEKFEHNEIYVTDLIITARALSAGITVGFARRSSGYGKDGGSPGQAYAVYIIG